MSAPRSPCACLPPAASTSPRRHRRQAFFPGRAPTCWAKLEAEHGADPADVKKVEDFAAQNHLAVVESSAGRRSVKLAGTVATFSQAFNVKLQRWEHPGGTYRGREGPIQVPSALGQIVVGVFGLDDRPFAKPHLRRLRRSGNSSANTSYSPPQVAQFYNFPTGVDGTGQVIGIIELGGGYRPADLQTYAQQLGIPVPTVIPVSVNYGKEFAFDRRQRGRRSHARYRGRFLYRHRSQDCGLFHAGCHRP